MNLVRFCIYHPHHHTPPPTNGKTSPAHKIHSKRPHPAMETVTLVNTIILGLLVLFVCWKFWNSQLVINYILLCSRKLPPLQGGSIPWAGCAISFGREPLHFIRKSHEKVYCLFTGIHINLFTNSLLVWRYFYNPSGWKMDDIHTRSKLLS